MGDGWRFDFKRTYFDYYSPPDFYTKVSQLISLHTSNKKLSAISHHISSWFHGFLIKGGHNWSPR